MSCDIHGYIEYKSDIGDNYRGFGGRLSDRDYRMFGCLADVMSNGYCVYAPKGIPDNLGWEAKNDYCLFIVDDNPTDYEGYTTKENAIEWVQHGYSHYWDKEHKWITHPDWHTPSWLTADEYEVVLNKRKELSTDGWELDEMWDGILAVLKVLPNSRFVFWFDN